MPSLYSFDLFGDDGDGDRGLPQTNFFVDMWFFNNQRDYSID